MSAYWPIHTPENRSDRLRSKYLRKLLIPPTKHLRPLGAKSALVPKGQATLALGNVGFRLQKDEPLWLSLMHTGSLESLWWLLTVSLNILGPLGGV